MRETRCAPSSSSAAAGGGRRDHPLDDAFHDVKNLLGVISLNASRLGRKLRPTGDVLRHLEMISRSAEELVELSRLLEEHARLQAGHLRLEPTPFDAVELAEEASQRVRRPPRVPAPIQIQGQAGRVVGDRALVAQALTYLLQIELDRCADGSQVRLEVAPATSGTSFRTWAEAEHEDPAEEAVARHRRALAHHIAQGLVAAHGGTWEPEPHPRGLPRVRFVLP
jgi:K+-sensing histidine kinase KdpD